MNLSWFKGLNAQKKKEVTENFTHSVVVRHRLQEMLKIRIEESRRIMRSKSSYDTPNWAYLQADAVGYERALDEVCNLLNNDANKDEPTR